MNSKDLSSPDKIQTLCLPQTFCRCHLIFDTFFVFKPSRNTLEEILKKKEFLFLSGASSATDLTPSQKRTAHECDKSEILSHADVIHSMTLSLM